MILHKSVTILCLFFLAGSVFGRFEITFLHVNDIHSTLEGLNYHTDECAPEITAEGKTYGGLARIAKAVENIKSEEEHVLFLNAGGDFQGSYWYTKYKSEFLSKCMRLLNLDVSAIGSSDFDDGVDGLFNYVQDTNHPFVCANCDFSEVPHLGSLVSTYRSYEVNGRKVCIVGHTTTQTSTIAKPGPVTFRDELEALQDLAPRIEADCCQITIALGSSGYEVDKKIAAEVPYVDIVIGGGTQHTFLFSGDVLPSTEKPEGPYPTWVERKGQKDHAKVQRVPVVQAYHKTKYLGKLVATFTDDNELIFATGNPILLDSATELDQDILDEINSAKPQILSDFENSVITHINVALTTSETRESNLGNFIADSMVAWYQNQEHPPQGYEIKPYIAFLNSGGIKGDIKCREIRHDGVIAVLPFNNTLDVATVTGSDLKEMFEYMASTFEEDGTADGGVFLQVSESIRLELDLTKAEGERVVSLKEKCPLCEEFILVEDDTVYPIITLSFLMDGGDGYTILRDRKTNYHKGSANDYKVLETYLAFHDENNPIDSNLEGRTTMTVARPKCDCSDLDNIPEVFE